MEIIVNKNGTELTVCPVGKLDTATSPQLQAAIDENISGVTDLTFDLKKLAYLSSAGLRVLMSAQKTMNKQGNMRLSNVNEDIMDILDMTGLTDVFTIV
ncbi:MAG: STAS domain-containing protein [Ruminococcus sp.]|nr:STAS domain-containing protein [Ruminococcus sp.]